MLYFDGPGILLALLPPRRYAPDTVVRLTANGTGAGFHICPGIVLEGMAIAFPIPGLGNRIVGFPAVRIHDNRKIRFFSKFLDKAFKVFRFCAVDAEGP